MFERTFPSRGWAVALALVLAVTTIARGQSQDVELAIGPDDVGLGSPGFLRPGCWTPLRVNVKATGNTVRQVVVQWVLNDTDGDYVVAEQPFTVSPSQSVQRQSRWLYAQPTVSTTSNTLWDVHVLDAESRELLDTQKISPMEIVDLRDNAIGVIGAPGASMGLQRYQEQHTQHEKNRFIRIPSMDDLPDRWYGLSMLEALIWTKAGGDPGQMPRSSQQALREWVQRGGHLVVVLPYVGDQWMRSGLHDMLPAVTTVQHSDQPMPEFLGRRGDMEQLRLDYRELRLMTDDEARQQGLQPASEVSVLLSTRDADGVARPLVVAHRYGFGRVTLIGTDLTDPRVNTRGLPNTATFWQAVFGWRSPAYEAGVLQRQMDVNFKPRLVHWDSRRNVSLLGRQVESLIAMRETAAPALLLAILLFIGYWVAAGPGGFAYLRSKGMLHHSWMAFVAVVAAVSVFAWGGAYLIRPSRTTIRHFTVLDADTTNGTTVRAHSWASLFVPQHGLVDVVIAPEMEGINTNVMGSAGIMLGAGMGGFVDPQRYLINAGSPATAQIPFRSTSKQLELDYMGDLEKDAQWIAGTWKVPRPADDGLRAQQISERAWIPIGKLVHDLPDTLHEVLLVYCDGDGADPMVHRLTQPWKPGAVLELKGTLSWTPLVIDRSMNIERNFHQEGYLGQLMAAMANIRVADEEQVQDQLVEVLPQQFVQQIELLTFFSTLPPPDFRNANFLTPSHNYLRPVGRSMDRSSLMATRQLLVIGHLQSSPLPIPLRVDGSRIPSEGWTVVRSICAVRPQTTPDM